MFFIAVTWPNFLFRQKRAAKLCFVSGHWPNVIIRSGEKRVLIFRSPDGDPEVTNLSHAVVVALARVFVDRTTALLQKKRMHVTILSLILLVLLPIAILSNVADLIPSTLAEPAI